MIPEERLSPAVARALNIASALAQQRGRQITAFDMIESLLTAEGKASQWLRSAGLSEQICAELVQSGKTSELPFALTESLRDADKMARDLANENEVSTEHLLFAIIQQEKSIIPLLEEHGVSVSFFEKIPQADSDVSTPIPTDIRLDPVEKAVDDLASVYRILDAAANRCREGLRVVEDYARFALEDKHLSGQLKSLRHQLACLMDQLLKENGVAMRDTPSDVGTDLTARLESIRSSNRDILHSNCRRIQEAFRTIEEFAKRISPETASQIEQLRYESYTVEKALLTTQNARQRLDRISLCLLVTDALCPRGLGPVVQAALQGGCRMIQLREKTMLQRRWLDVARMLREWTSQAGALLIINDRPDIAVLSDADGVHLGQDDLSVQAARQIVGADRLIGVSTHNIAQARQAVLDGADYLGVGPCFPSKTKTFENFAGLDFVREVAEEISLPWFAIGGIHEENVGQLQEQGASRIAVSHAICGQHDPEHATRSLLNRLTPLKSYPLRRPPAAIG